MGMELIGNMGFCKRIPILEHIHKYRHEKWKYQCLYYLGIMFKSYLPQSGQMEFPTCISFLSLF